MPRSTKIIGSGVYTDELRRIYTLVTRNKRFTPEQIEDMAVLYRNAKQELLRLGKVSSLVMLWNRGLNSPISVNLSDLELEDLLRRLTRNRNPTQAVFFPVVTTRDGVQYGLFNFHQDIETLKEIMKTRRQKRNVTLKFEDDLRLYIGGPRIIKRPEDPEEEPETISLTPIKTGDSMTDLNREYYTHNKYHSTSDVQGYTNANINAQLPLGRPLTIPKSLGNQLPITREDRYVAVIEGEEPPNIKPTSKEGFISKIRARLFGPRQPPPIVENMTINPLVPELDQFELLTEQVRRRPEHLLTPDELNAIMANVQLE